MADDCTSRLVGLNITGTPLEPSEPLDRNGIIVPIDEHHSLHIPLRIWDAAEPLALTTQTRDRCGAAARVVEAISYVKLL